MSTEIKETSTAKSLRKKIRALQKELYGYSEKVEAKGRKNIDLQNKLYPACNEIRAAGETMELALDQMSEAIEILDTVK